MTKTSKKSGLQATTMGLKAHLMTRSGGACYYCGWNMGEDSGYPLTVDHCTPGVETIENYWLACRSCNSQKRNRTVEEYRRYVWLQRLRKAANLPEAPWTPVQLEWVASLNRFEVNPVLFFIEYVEGEEAP